MKKERRGAPALWRVLSAALALALLMGALPAATADETIYGVVTADKVMFRPSIGTTDYISRLNTGWVMQIVKTTTSGGQTYFEVSGGTPEQPDRVYSGYISGKFFRQLSADEQAAWLNSGKPQPSTYGGGVAVITNAPITAVTATPAPGATSAPSAVTGKYGVTTAGGVNLRQTASGTGTSLTSIANGALVYLLEIPSTTTDNDWYKVIYNGTTGYIKATFLRVLSDAEVAALLYTATPAVTDSSTPAGGTGYIKITKANTNIRSSMGGETKAQAALNRILPYYMGPFTSGGYSWVYVFDALTKTYGYVRGDCFIYCDAQGNPAKTTPTPATAAPAVTQTPSPVTTTGYVKITKANTNIRDAVGGQTKAQALKDSVLPYYTGPFVHAGYAWVYVYDLRTATYGYVRSDCYTYCDAQGNPITSPTATPTAAPFVTQTPAPTGYNAPIGYVKITLQGTNLRQEKAGKTLSQLDKNRVLPYYSAPSTASGYSWVYVYDSKSTYYGYVRSDCYTFCDQNGNLVTATPVSIITPTPQPYVGGYVKTLVAGVNVRDSAGGKTIYQVAKNVLLPYTATQTAGGYLWYKVNGTGGTGYVRADTVEVVGATATPVGFTPTPVVVTATPAATPAGTKGYIITTKSSVNLRQYAKVGATSLTKIDISTILPMLANAVTSGGYTWYYVQTGAYIGYVRGDCARQLSQAEVDAYLKGQPLPVVTATPAPSKPSTYLITTLDDVNLRASASKASNALFNVKLGTVIQYTTTTVSAGALWYKASYQNTVVYILASCARVLTQAEYEAYIKGLPTATPSPSPSPTPAAADLSNYAVTISANVLVRAAGSASGKQLTKLYKSGQMCEYLGVTNVSDGYTWYKVKAVGVTGWIRGDFLRVLTKTEYAMYQKTGDPDAPPEASYRTLTIGSTGSDVLAVQTKLAALGYLTAADLTGSYLTTSATAVKAYQKDNGLVVDGVAGSSTQHKLFNTVPVGTYGGTGGSTVTPVIYPVELVDWYTGDIQTVWAKGATATLTDVKTGISFRVKRWSGGYHADVEPLTAADTAAMCKVYGVSNAQQISDKNLYQRHPVWITVGGRTFAASMYGVPHNYPDGDTIADNDYNGQFCVHFVNSRVHKSGAVDADHQTAIMYAYNNAPSKK